MNVSYMSRVCDESVNSTILLPGGTLSDPWGINASHPPHLPLFISSNDIDLDFLSFFGATDGTTFRDMDSNGGGDTK